MPGKRKSPEKPNRFSYPLKSNENPGSDNSQRKKRKVIDSAQENQNQKLGQENSQIQGQGHGSSRVVHSDKLQTGAITVNTRASSSSNGRRKSAPVKLVRTTSSCDQMNYVTQEEQDVSNLNHQNKRNSYMNNNPLRNSNRDQDQRRDFNANENHNRRKSSSETRPVTNSNPSQPGQSQRPYKCQGNCPAPDHNQINIPTSRRQSQNVQDERFQLSNDPRASRNQWNMEMALQFKVLLEEIKKGKEERLAMQNQIALLNTRLREAQTGKNAELRGINGGKERNVQQHLHQGQGQGRGQGQSQGQGQVIDEEESENESEEETDDDESDEESFDCSCCSNDCETEDDEEDEETELEVYEKHSEQSDEGEITLPLSPISAPSSPHFDVEFSPVGTDFEKGKRLMKKTIKKMIWEKANLQQEIQSLNETLAGALLMPASNTTNIGCYSDGSSGTTNYLQKKFAVNEITERLAPFSGTLEQGETLLVPIKPAKPPAEKVECPYCNKLLAKTSLERHIRNHCKKSTLTTATTAKNVRSDRNLRARRATGRNNI